MTRPPIQMKWHNINLGFRIAINSGPALLLWAAGFFVLTHMAAHHDKLVSLYTIVITAWTGGFGGYLVKRHKNNTLKTNGEAK